MNDRINDLMYHAGLTAQGCWDEMDDYDRKAILKLVELIVLECATWIDKQPGWDGPYGHELLKHFGVGE